MDASGPAAQDRSTSPRSSPGLAPSCGRVAGEAIELCWDIEPELPPVRLERERFERIVVNLIANARNAIEAGLVRPGKIELRLERVRAAPLAVAAVGGDPSGEQYVRLSVRDNGCGMNSAVRQRVFEPFFTTRSNKGGSGLGLADVADFARETGSVVTLESAPGAGCEVALRFPPAISREV